MEDKPDHALVAEVARGDAAALRALYLRYERPTFNLILRLAGNREMAQDMMQETFTRVWTRARTFRGDQGSFKGWLFTIALNVTRSELARHLREVVVLKVYHHLKFREIAEITKTPEGTLKARFHRGGRAAGAVGA